MLNLLFFCHGVTRGIRPNLFVLDLSVFVWFLHDNKETDGTDLTLRFEARVEKPIQGGCPSRTSFTSLKILVF